MMYVTLFVTFVKIGLLGFGGGLAIVRLIYDSIQPFMAISQEQFANIVAISQITPGPLGVNVATYVGHEYAGIPGAIVATLGVAVPAFVLISIVCRMLRKFQDSKAVKGMLSSIRAATIGLIGAAAITLTAPAVAGATRLGSGIAGVLGPRVTDALANTPIDFVAILMVAATAILIAKYKKSPFVVLLIMGCIGAVLGVQY